MDENSLFIVQLCMAVNETNRRDKPEREWFADVGLLLFIGLGLFAVSLPHLAISFFGVYWAALIAIGVFTLWFSLMPTTCINGGLICSIVAMMIMFNTVGIALLAAIRFVVLLVA